MATAKSPRDSKPEVINVEKKDGLLDELNLSPQIISFLRKNALAIEIVAGLVIVLILAWSYYDYHSQGEKNQASLALSTAIKQKDKTARMESLTNVTKEYAGTGAALWSRLEEGHLAFDEGHYDEALRHYQKVYDDLADDNPLRPLVTYAVALADENAGKLDQALTYYQRLADSPGFKTLALAAEGRVYELKGDKANALKIYRQVAEERTLSAARRSVIQEKINSLQAAVPAAAG